MFNRRPNVALEDRGPLRVMFINTSLVVGGAEVLLAEIGRNMDRERFEPELCCLKDLEELGEVLAEEVTTHKGLLEHKYDWKVLGRLTKLLRERRTDAVVTVGTGGDRMFWGRLAAWRADVPVILSALHSTGHPQVVEPINRALAPITDGFIACAKRHAEYLFTGEGCPEEKVFTVWNGVDTDRFYPRDKAEMRERLDLPQDVPIVGIVAALRPEKQHVMLVEAMSHVIQKVPEAMLVIVGDGETRPAIEERVRELGLESNVRLLGTRRDVPECLAAMDVKVLSSKMEANPASTLEAGATGLPVIAPNVGSLPDTIMDNETGILVEPDNIPSLSEAILRVVTDSALASAMGEAARDHVCRRFSLDCMVRGYEMLIENLYRESFQGRVLDPSNFDQIVEKRLKQLYEARQAATVAEPIPQPVG